MNDGYDGLQQIIDEVMGSMATESTGEFDLQRSNSSEFCHRVGLSRQRAKTIKANGFRVKPHSGLGLKLTNTVLSVHTGLTDNRCGRYYEFDLMGLRWRTWTKTRVTR